MDDFEKQLISEFDLNTYLIENIDDIVFAAQNQLEYYWDDIALKKIYKIIYICINKYSNKYPFKADLAQECIIYFFSKLIYRVKNLKNIEDNIGGYLFVSFKYFIFSYFKKTKQEQFEESVISLDETMTISNKETKNTKLNYVASDTNDALNNLFLEMDKEIVKKLIQNDPLLNAYIIERKTYEEIASKNKREGIYPNTIIGVQKQIELRIGRLVDPLKFTKHLMTLKNMSLSELFEYQNLFFEIIEEDKILSEFFLNARTLTSINEDKIAKTSDIRALSNYIKNKIEKFINKKLNPLTLKELKEQPLEVIREYKELFIEYIFDNHNMVEYFINGKSMSQIARENKIKGLSPISRPKVNYNLTSNVNLIIDTIEKKLSLEDLKTASFYEIYVYRNLIINEIKRDPVLSECFINKKTYETIAREWESNGFGLKNKNSVYKNVKIKIIHIVDNKLNGNNIGLKDLIGADLDTLFAYSYKIIPLIGKNEILEEFYINRKSARQIAIERKRKGLILSSAPSVRNYIKTTTNDIIRKKLNPTNLEKFKTLSIPDMLLYKEVIIKHLGEDDILIEFFQNGKQIPQIAKERQEKGLNCYTNTGVWLYIKNKVAKIIDNIISPVTLDSLKDADLHQIRENKHLIKELINNDPIFYKFFIEEKSGDLIAQENKKLNISPSSRTAVHNYINNKIQEYLDLKLHTMTLEDLKDAPIRTIYKYRYLLGKEVEKDPILYEYFINGKDSVQISDELKKLGKKGSSKSVVSAYIKKETYKIINNLIRDKKYGIRR